jgi:hypothetical protein
VGQLHDGRVDEDLLGFAEGAGTAEDAEGVDGGDGEWPPLVEAATQEGVVTIQLRERRGGMETTRRERWPGRSEGSSTSSQIFGRKVVLRTSMISRASWPTWARAVRRSAVAWRLRVLQ